MFNKSIWWFNKISKEINQSYKKNINMNPKIYVWTVHIYLKHKKGKLLLHLEALKKEMNSKFLKNCQ